MAVDVTGINNLQYVVTYAENYKKALNNAMTSVNNTTINKAIKGSAQQAAFRTYQNYVTTRVKTITKTLDNLIASINQVKNTYSKVEQASVSSLNASKNKLKS